MKRKFGFKKSKIDGSEKIFSAAISSLPEKYSYKSFLPPVLNQGTSSTCVPCSLSAYLNWKENLKDGSKIDNKIDLYAIYKSRTSSGDEGMTFKDAFKYLRHNGVKSNKGVLSINSYAMVKSHMMLKAALITNGPCFGALPVYNNDDDFWNRRGDDLLGAHAVAIVGFDEKGFIIRNSWGKSYGKNGYGRIEYEDFNSFIEIWTILD